ncbi:hypothetical protein EMCRGX_G020997 [Ephydatia muelleri]|eukprot:Em0016g912a
MVARFLAILSLHAAILSALFFYGSATDELPSPERSSPTILVAILARNHAYTLPDFLGYLERQDYPKDKLSFWIRTDHNEDDTAAILRGWTDNVRTSYANVDFYSSTEVTYVTPNPFDMPDARYTQIAQLRQKALDAARAANVDYLFFVDCDNFLVNPSTLRLLVQENKPIIAPLLTVNNESRYTNFWGGQDQTGYYKRTDDYIPIATRERLGCFKVAVVHSTYLVDLRTQHSTGLVFWPPAKGFHGPVDDVVQFAYSIRQQGLEVYVLNTHEFGYLLHPMKYSSLQEAADAFTDYKLKTLVFHPLIPRSENIPAPSKPKDNVGLDAVFMISLARRPERRNRMLACLDELAFNYTLFDAVDGRELNQSYVDSLGIHYLPGWRDPWGERPMTMGEVGCFLSHYTIWEKMVEQQLKRVLILEDDVDFEPKFKKNLRLLLDETETLKLDWDLIFVGRKVLNWNEEELITGSQMLVRPSYSYWTLGYLLSLSGAQKLINARPFDNLLPVDEYFPIMYNRHAEQSWADHFNPRNLNAFSAHPLLVYPTHYVGDAGWYSDTEPPPEVLEVIRKKKALEEQASKSASGGQVETAGADGPDVTVQSTEEVGTMEHKQRLLREQVKREELEALRAKLKKLEL